MTMTAHTSVRRRAGGYQLLGAAALAAAGLMVAGCGQSGQAVEAAPPRSTDTRVGTIAAADPTPATASAQAVTDPPATDAPTSTVASPTTTASTTAPTTSTVVKVPTTTAPTTTAPTTTTTRPTTTTFPLDCGDTDTADDVSTEATVALYACFHDAFLAGRVGTILRDYGFFMSEPGGKTRILWELTAPGTIKWTTSQPDGVTFDSRCTAMKPGTLPESWFPTDCTAIDS